MACAKQWEEELSIRQRAKNHYVKTDMSSYSERSRKKTGDFVSLNEESLSKEAEEEDDTEGIEEEEKEPHHDGGEEEEEPDIIEVDKRI